MSGETKLFIGIGIVSVLIVVIGVILFSRPEPTFTRQELIPADAPTKGATSSANFLVEFSDFQCPACKAFEPEVEKVAEKYKDKMQYVYRYFPLKQHQYAQQAAEAAEAARQQGKFWEMYRYLFENQDQISPEMIANSGKAVGLDEKIFADALSKATYRERVQKDLADGLRLGINATPTFFMNGKKLELSNPSDLDRIVSQALK